MTLVETIVAFVIAGILIAATGALIIAGMNFFNDTVAKNLDKQIGDDALEIVTEKIQYAKSVKKASSVPSDTTSGAIYVEPEKQNPERGKLFIKKEGTDEVIPVFAQEDFYSGRLLNLTCEFEDTGDKAKAVTITVKVFDGDKEKYSKSSTIQLLNYTAEDGTGNGSGSIIVYTPVE